MPIMALETKQPEHVAAPRAEVRYQRSWFTRLPLWPRRSIRVRLQLSHLVTSLLPLLILGIALLYMSAQAERRIVEQTQQSVAQSIARDISDMMAQTENELLTFGRRVPLSSTNRALIEAAAKDFLLQHYPATFELAVLDIDGNERARVSQTKVYFAGELLNRVEEPFFRPATQGLIHRDVIADAAGRRWIQIGVPARNGVGQVIGVVVARIDSKDIEQSLSTVPHNTGRSAFIMNRWGNVLLGAAPTALTGAPSLRDWALSVAPFSRLRGNDNQEVTAARAVIEPGSWSVVVEQPTEIAYFSSRRNTWLVALMLLATSAVVIVWALLLARELTRPIVQLRDAVRSLGSGHLGDTIAVHRADELGSV